VIFHAADDHGLAIELGQDSTEVVMQFLAQRTLVQEWPTVFRGKNRVNQNLCQRLRHGARMSEERIDSTPFRVVEINAWTQGSPSRNRANPGLNDSIPLGLPKPKTTSLTLLGIPLKIAKNLF